MFKEKYIKDNDLIKPDDDFLEHLKNSVAKEEKVVHIGDFVDYENTEQFEQLENVQEASTVEKSKGMRWQSVTAIAACLAIMLVAAFVAGNSNMFGENKIQADVGKFVSEELEESEQTGSQVDEECIRMYNQVADWFANCNAIVYEMDTYQPSEAGLDYMQESKDQWRKLEVQERNELISDITSDGYVLTDVVEGWDSITYYIAEFDNQSYAVFGICEGQYIYIVEISGLQSMAAK